MPERIPALGLELPQSAKTNDRDRLMPITHEGTVANKSSSKLFPGSSPQLSQPAYFSLLIPAWLSILFRKFGSRKHYVRSVYHSGESHASLVSVGPRLVLQADIEVQSPYPFSLGFLWKFPRILGVSAAEWIIQGPMEKKAFLRPFGMQSSNSWIIRKGHENSSSRLSPEPVAGKVSAAAVRALASAAELMARYCALIEFGSDRGVLFARGQWAGGPMPTSIYVRARRSHSGTISPFPSAHSANCLFGK